MKDNIRQYNPHALGALTSEQEPRPSCAEDRPENVMSVLIELGGTLARVDATVENLLQFLTGFNIPREEIFEPGTMLGAVQSFRNNAQNIETMVTMIHEQLQGG